MKEITTEPAFYDDVVELDRKYYKAGGKRLEVRDTKVGNDNFCLLTLAAAAEQLKTLPGRVVAEDIGSWLIDIMPIENGRPEGRRS